MRPPGHYKVCNSLLPRGMRNHLEKQSESVSEPTEYGVLTNGVMLLCVLESGTVTCYRENKCRVIKSLRHRQSDNFISPLYHHIIEQSTLDIFYGAEQEDELLVSESSSSEVIEYERIPINLCPFFMQLDKVFDHAVHFLINVQQYLHIHRWIFSWQLCLSQQNAIDPRSEISVFIDYYFSVIKHIYRYKDRHKNIGS